MTEKNSAGFKKGGGFYEVEKEPNGLSKIRFGFGDKYDESKWGTIYKIPKVSRGHPITTNGDNQYINFLYTGYKNKLTSYYELCSDGMIIFYKNRATIDPWNITKKMKNPNEDPWTEYCKTYRGEAKKNKELADRLFSEKITEQEPYLTEWETYYPGSDGYDELLEKALLSRPDLKNEILNFIPENYRPKTLS